MPTAYLATRSGTTEFVRQSFTSTYSQQTGWTNVFVNVGPADGLVAFLTTVSPAVTKIEISEEGAMRIVTTTIGGGDEYNPDGTITVPADPISRVWTLAANSVQKPLVEADFLLKYYGTATLLSRAISRVKSQIAKYRAAVAAVAAEGLPGGASVLPENYRNELVNTVMEQPLFDRLVVDDDIFETSQFVLQVVEEVSQSSVLTASYANVNRLFTTAALKVAEPTLDSATLIAIDEIDSVPNPMYWKKQGPTVTSTLGGKVEMTRSYYGYQAYDSWRYGALIV